MLHIKSARLKAVSDTPAMPWPTALVSLTRNTFGKIVLPGPAKLSDRFKKAVGRPTIPNLRRVSS